MTAFNMLGSKVFLRLTAFSLFTALGFGLDANSVLEQANRLLSEDLERKFNAGLTSKPYKSNEL